MELKRILAKDTRSANEKAIALYGPDVLVISNHQVDGQTELVVALDVPAEPLVEAPAASPKADFQQTFVQAQQAAAPAPSPRPEPATEFAPAAIALAAQAAKAAPAPSPAPLAPAVVEAAPATEASTTENRALEDARELQRSRELVDLVRSEIAALRREFRLSQQAAAWQGGLTLHPNLDPLVDALNDSPVPTALRALLLDALQDQSDPHEALGLWRAQLEHSLARPQVDMPTQGVQVLAGPSGGGKTLMCARLARHACGLHGAEAVALISYRDQRAGAWSQVQMLGAQLGIDCFRASDEEALRLLLSELSPRALVLVDTPGVEMAQRLAEIRASAPQAGLHAVVPADASGVTLRKVLIEPGLAWHSVMLSKLDEAQAPWPLLQLFSDNDLKLSCASDGSRMSDLMTTFTPSQLIELALAPLAQASASAAAVPALPAAPARTARRAPTAKPAAKPVAKAAAKSSAQAAKAAEKPAAKAAAATRKSAPAA